MMTREVVESLWDAVREVNALRAAFDEARDPELAEEITYRLKAAEVRLRRLLREVRVS